MRATFGWKTDRGTQYWPLQNNWNKSIFLSTVLTKKKEQSFQGLYFLFIVNYCTWGHKKTEHLLENWWFCLGELKLWIGPSRKGSLVPWISCQSWILNLGDDHSWCFRSDSWQDSNLPAFTNIFFPLKVALSDHNNKSYSYPFWSKYSFILWKATKCELDRTQILQ